MIENKKRSQCTCPCHTPGSNMTHFMPCCYPDKEEEGNMITDWLEKNGNPEISRQVEVEALFSEDEKYRELYRKSQHFNTSVRSIIKGANKYEVIYELCKIIEKQTDIIGKIIRNNDSINL